MKEIKTYLLFTMNDEPYIVAQDGMNMKKVYIDSVNDPYSVLKQYFYPGSKMFQFYLSFAYIDDISYSGDIWYYKVYSENNDLNISFKLVGIEEIEDCPKCKEHWCSPRYDVVFPLKDEYKVNIADYLHIRKDKKTLVLQNIEMKLEDDIPNPIKINKKEYFIHPIDL